MLIGLLDYYPIYLKGASDGLKEFGNLRFLELYKEGEKNEMFCKVDSNKYEIEKTNAKSISVDVNSV